MLKTQICVTRSQCVNSLSHTLMTLPTLSVTQCMIYCNCYNKQPFFHIIHSVHCESTYKVYQHHQLHCSVQVYRVLCCLCAATCFGVIPVSKELIPMLLKRTTIQQLYINHTYQMCSFHLTFTKLKMMVQFDVGFKLSHFNSWFLVL